MLKESIGVRWWPVQTSTSFWRNKEPMHAASLPTVVWAPHIECNSNQVQHVKYKLAKLYGSSSKRFLDRTKMRPIPPFNNVNSTESKENYGIVVARWLAFTSKLGKDTTWEILQNLLLDHKIKDSGLSLRSVPMSIESSKYPGFSVFHAIDWAISLDWPPIWETWPQNGIWMLLQQNLWKDTKTLLGILKWSRYHPQPMYG